MTFRVFRGESSGLTTDVTDFTDGTDEEEEENEERFGFRFICVIREICVIRGAAAWLRLHALVLMSHEPDSVGCQSIKWNSTDSRPRKRLIVGWKQIEIGPPDLAISSAHSPLPNATPRIETPKWRTWSDK